MSRPNAEFGMRNAESEPAHPAKEASAYWRSLDELAQTPEFVEQTRKEFPGFANIYEGLGEAEVEGGISRRQFLALSAAALALAGVGCYRRPDLQILPYSQKPENVTPGLPIFYATTLNLPQGPFPVLVESHEGRPTKVEGNPQHPLSKGASGVHAQASILDLYSPDRVRTVTYQGKTSTWEAFDAFAGPHFKKLQEANGKGLFVLSESVKSPSLQAVKDQLKKAKKGDGGKVESEGTMAESSWHTFDAIDTSNEREALQIAFGESVNRTYHFDKAERVLVLDADPFGGDADSVRHARDFMSRRKAPDDESLKNWEPNRLYVVESSYTTTGTMADHRLRLPTSQAVDYLVGLAKAIVPKANKPASRVTEVVGQLPRPALDVPSHWIEEVAADLVAHAGKSLIVCGPKQPATVQFLAVVLNDLLANREKTVSYRSSSRESSPGLAELSAALDKGEVQTLVILGGNPVFTAPTDLDLAAKIKKVPTVIYLSQYADETSPLATWHLPQTHTLEEWGDLEASDGSYCTVQPLIAPLHGGRSSLELMMQLARFDAVESHKQAKDKILPLIKKLAPARAEKPEGFHFDAALQRGFVPAKPAEFAKPMNAEKVAEAIARIRLAAPVDDKQYEVVFAASNSLYDGRFAWNAWLMELPDPITKLVWDNAALISPLTAKTLGVTKNGEMLLISTSAGKIEIPAFILPGQANFSITLPLGYGGLRIAHAPGGGGFNVYPLRSSDNPHFGHATVKKTGKTYQLVTTQEWGAIPEGRDEIIHAFTVEEYKHHHEHEHKHPDPKENFQAGYAKALDTPRVERRRLDLAQPETLVGHHQWGMVVDLNSCTGCSACVVACQSENNVPVVGKGEVSRNREMHWIRLDRYFTSSGEVRHGLEASPAEDPQVVTQPMMCQHCEAAPCESVCPVNATVHSPEGLNLQVYNRCIGTRYCGNNCPYKVRRFNWFDFNQRQLDTLRVPTPFSDKGTAETLKMQKNPDVTVRSRGVMEKCTYCIQRIERGKIGAKLLAIQANYTPPPDPKLAGYDVRQEEGVKKIYVPDGVITPACAQACPTEAIVFGNVADRDSRAFKLKQREREYLVLGTKNTKPRTSYLPRLRNPNPKMGGHA
jgi:MoCo/4Fe-4S cofactor protein with predicted Tat translocation signal